MTENILEDGIDRNSGKPMNVDPTRAKCERVVANLHRRALLAERWGGIYFGVATGILVAGILSLAVTYEMVNERVAAPQREFWRGMSESARSLEQLANQMRLVTKDLESAPNSPKAFIDGNEAATLTNGMNALGNGLRELAGAMNNNSTLGIEPHVLSLLGGIFLRAAVAALVIYLAQICLVRSRYQRLLASHLLSSADALDLVGVPNGVSLADVVEALSPRAIAFGQPPAPTAQVLEAMKVALERRSSAP